MNMNSENRGSHSHQPVTPQTDRHVLEQCYRDQLPVCDRQDVLLCVHLGHLRDRLATLSGLRIIEGGPIGVEALRRQTQFVCADICVTSVSELIGSASAPIAASERFLRLWQEFSALHCLLWSGATEQALDTAIHALYFGAIALCVAAECKEASFELEEEWIPISHTLLPGARFDGSANEELVDTILQCLRNELDKIMAGRD